MPPQNKTYLTMLDFKICKFIGLCSLILALVNVGFVLHVNAYSQGAPTRACSTLIPGHGVDRQYSSPPYTIELIPSQRGTVSVILKAENKPFAGFMLQARSANEPSRIINGRFTEDKQSQTKSCNGNIPVI